MLAHVHIPATPAEQAAFAASDFAAGCEGTWAADYDRWRRDAFAAEQAPFIACSAMLNRLGCRTWPVRTRPSPVGSPDAPPMLVVAGGDHPAYYHGSLEVRRRFSRAVLATVPGSLTATIFSGNTCIDRTIARTCATGHCPSAAPETAPTRHALRHRNQNRRPPTSRPHKRYAQPGTRAARRRRRRS